MLNIKEKYEKCWYCENYYGPTFEEPVCLTCHFFIFPDLVEHNTQDSGNSTTTSSNASKAANNSANNNQSNLMVDDSVFLKKLESNDSGNEDSDNYSDQQQIYVYNRDETNQMNNNLNNNNNNDNNSDTSPESNKKMRKSKIRNDFENMNPLNEQIMALSLFNETCKPVEPGLVESLPTEVLWSIFRNLDDLTLWAVSLVCKRWYELIRQEISQKKWKSFISKRWILFNPSIKVRCFQTLYSQLVQSSNCFYCLRKIQSNRQIRTKSVCGEELKKSWRHKRLLLELKALQQDPPDGINARPLDSSCFHWQASITGPNGSPYEGGIFYLYLQIPQSYPLNPPLVRFITKIYHPNISKHGDIGLDSINENWSLALTISKVLISIQSLLTDPYTHVCMENEIGYLYKTNRDLYEKNAKIYTLKYAMTDFLIFDNQNDFKEYFDSLDIS